MSKKPGGGVPIPDDARKFAKLTEKRFKKTHSGEYDSKKEMRNAYFLKLLDLLPKSIDFIIRYGHIKNDNVQMTKEGIFAHLVDAKFVKFLRKEIKNGKIDSIKFLPIIISEIVMITNRENAEAKSLDPNAKIYDMSDLIELSQIILAKKLKKAKKLNIPEALAFDCLSVIPTEKILKISQNYRIRQLFDVLYAHAKKDETIPVASLMKLLMSDDYHPVVVVFGLLERKEKFGILTESQKTFYLAMSNWIFSTMENELNREQLSTVLQTYVRARTRDAEAGKDANRRYALATLSEDDYPRIAGAVKNLIARNDSAQKYLN